MTTPVTIASVIGSLRAGSFSRATFEAASKRVDVQTTLVEAKVSDVPLFNQDIEAIADPQPVGDLKRIVAGADGLIFFTPEYNRSMPAVTKNAIDWLSRPYGGGAITNKPVGIIASVPGRHAGEGVRGHLTDTLSVLSDAVFDPSLGISSMGHRVEDGVLTDDEALTDLSLWLHDFADYVRTRGKH